MVIVSPEPPRSPWLQTWGGIGAAVEGFNTPKTAKFSSHKRSHPFCA
jgi:hypothetical protein